MEVGQPSAESPGHQRNDADHGEWPVYFSMDQKRFIVAADAATGETIWVYRPNEGARFDGAPRKIHRGVSYWTDGRGDDRIVFATPGFHLIALNAKTGAPVPGFGTNGIVDMMKDLDIDYKGDPNGKIGNSSPVVISNDVIVIGPAHLRPTKTNVKGDVLAYDVRRPARRSGSSTRFLERANRVTRPG